jgi:thiamine pyrophosphokinase
MTPEPRVSAGRRHAVVLADGAIPTREDLDQAWPGWDDGVALVIAADGGARHARVLGLALDRWVGDGDSIAPADLAALAAAGVPIDRVAQEKDASDAELAVLAAIEAGADELTILGALGGPRIDHALVNVGLLGHPALAGLTVRLYDERAGRISLIEARAGEGPVARELAGHIDDLVTLVPFGGPAQGVTTRELRYPLRDETLQSGSSRGLSNVRTSSRAVVSLRAGRLLVIETPATVDR